MRQLTPWLAVILLAGCSGDKHPDVTKNPVWGPAVQDLRQTQDVAKFASRTSRPSRAPAPPPSRSTRGVRSLRSRCEGVGPCQQTDWPVQSQQIIAFLKAWIGHLAVTSDLVRALRG